MKISTQIKHVLCSFKDIHSHVIPLLELLFAAPFPFLFPHLWNRRKPSHSEKPSLTAILKQQMQASAPDLGEQKSSLRSALHYPEHFSQGGGAAFPLNRIFRSLGGFFSIWGLMVSLQKSAWRLKSNCLRWSPTLLCRGSFMRVFIHLRGQEEAFSLQLLPMNQLAAALPIFFLQDFWDMAFTTLWVSNHSGKPEALFPVSSLSPSRKKLGFCTFVTYLV